MPGAIVVVVVDRGYGLGFVGYITNSFINLKNQFTTQKY